MLAHPESAIGRIVGNTEQGDRTTTIAVLAAAQNGTSGVLADGKHAGRRAAWATPQTGVLRQCPSVRRATHSGLLGIPWQALDILIRDRPLPQEALHVR
jgi:hypothetical protein